jgi:hypothetical protein
VGASRKIKRQDAKNAKIRKRIIIENSIYGVLGVLALSLGPCCFETLPYW